MTTKTRDVRTAAAPTSAVERRRQIASYVLIGLGFIDLVRGFMHTINIRWAATNIAQVDLTSAMAGDFMLQMSAFGISNYVTGFLAILIGLQAKKLAPLVLALIPASYLLGIVSMNMNNIQPQSAFNGRYMMFGYLAICIITALYYYLPGWLGRDDPPAADGTTSGRT